MCTDEMTRSEAFTFICRRPERNVVVQGDVFYRWAQERVQASSADDPYWHSGVMPDGLFVTHDSLRLMREFLAEPREEVER